MISPVSINSRLTNKKRGFISHAGPQKEGDLPDENRPGKGFGAMMDQERQIKSKQRVKDHGEVFTPKHIVNDMLDLVRHETERIDSRFLEPACGTGNFLVGILRRKLDVVKNRYRKDQFEYEKYAVIAVSSIYGIDLLKDNVLEARNRLFAAFDSQYTGLYGPHCKEECRKSVRFLLDRNILAGDALTLRTDNNEPIVFSEWSAVNDTMIKRRDFTFSGLLYHQGMRDLPLFSDLGDDVFIPTPVKDYPLIHFLRLADHD